MKRWGFRDPDTGREFIAYDPDLLGAALKLAEAARTFPTRAQVRELPSLEAEGTIAVEDSRTAPGA